MKKLFELIEMLEDSEYMPNNTTGYKLYNDKIDKELRITIEFLKEGEKDDFCIDLTYDELENEDLGEVLDETIYIINRYCLSKQDKNDIALENHNYYKADL